MYLRNKHTVHNWIHTHLESWLMTQLAEKNICYCSEAYSPNWGRGTMASRPRGGCGWDKEALVLLGKRTAQTGGSARDSAVGRTFREQMEATVTLYIYTNDNKCFALIRLSKELQNFLKTAWEYGCGINIMNLFWKRHQKQN